MERPNWLLDINADDYHAATKRNEYVTSHRLNLFRKCPALYKKHADGEIVETDTAAFTLGRATHTRIIEGVDAFAREYDVTDGPINEKTGKPYGRATEVYRKWEATRTRKAVSSEDYALILKMDAAVHSHEKANELLATGYAEGTIRAEWCDSKTQCRLDWYCPERNILVDLKTCADVDKFKYDVRDFGYIHQLAFYAHHVAWKRTDGETPDCWLIAVEKREPFRVAVYRILPNTIDEANVYSTERYGACNEKCLSELDDCNVSGNWPTRYEGFGEI